MDEDGGFHDPNVLTRWHESVFYQYIYHVSFYLFRSLFPGYCLSNPNYVRPDICMASKNFSLRSPIFTTNFLIIDLSNNVDKCTFYYFYTWNYHRYSYLPFPTLRSQSTSNLKPFFTRHLFLQHKSPKVEPLYFLTVSFVNSLSTILLLSVKY